MKAGRKTGGKRRATAGGRKTGAASVEMLRLPPRAEPVRRRLSTAPYRGQVAAAARDCTTTCLADCNRLPTPLRSICTKLCRNACGQ